MVEHDQDFGSELNNYINSANKASTEQEEDWTLDEKLGVYVMHSKQLVMYQVDNTWVCGDYNQIYSDRYVYDSQTQIWLDTVTNEYSIYNESTQMYVPLTDEYWQGHPEGTHSIRFVIQSSPHYISGQVALVDENGMTIGRDRSWDCRLRLAEMIVSKYHAMVFLDKGDKLFYMIDNGSQHGTFVNEKRLSEPKQASLPYELRHLDIIRIGSTSMQVHLHHMGWPCQQCLASEFIQTTHHHKKDTKEVDKQPVADLEESRREWIKNAKKMYTTEDESNNKKKSSDYVDRAKIRRKNTKPEKFIDEQQYTRQQQVNNTPELSIIESTNYQTPVSGIGNKMLQKLGWQEGQGLGKHGEGIREPVRPSSNSSRTGLGISQPPANESKKDRHLRLTQERYKNSSFTQ